MMYLVSKGRVPFVLIPLLSVLAGCSSTALQREIEANHATAPSAQLVPNLPAEGVKGSAQDLQVRAAKAQDTQVVRRARLPWIGGAMVPVTQVDGLPALFNENYTLDFGDGRVALTVVAARLTKMTNVPVRVRTEPVASGAPVVNSSLGVAQGMPTSPITLSSLPGARTSTGSMSGGGNTTPASAVSSYDPISVDAVSMQWSGKLRDFLDHLANTLNLSWEYRDGAVIIASNIIESHPVAGMVGKQTFSNALGSSASGSAGSGGSTSALTSNDSYGDKGEVDVYEAILATVKNIVGTGTGRSVTPDASTGTIVVSAPKDVQAQVRDYLRDKNKSLSRMVNVTMDIYTVRDADGSQQGLNWNLVFQELSRSYSISATSPASLVDAGAGSVTLASIGGQTNGTNAILQALRSTGKSVQHKPVSLTTTNGQIKVQSSTASQGYVKSTTPGVATASGAAGAPGLNTDVVTTGDVFSVLPIIQPDNSVALKYSFRLSNLLSLTNFTSGTGTAAQTIQVPQTDSIGDSSRVRLAPGEALMITGLSRISSSASTARMGEGAPLVLGGSNNSSMSREHFVVVLRATPM